MSTPDPYQPGTPDQSGASTPSDSPAPRSDLPYGQQQPYGQQPYGQQQYPAQPDPGQYPQAYGQQQPENPGKTLGIVGLVLGFFGPLSIVGLILSIVGLVKSRKVGQPNGVAVAGIIVSALVLIGTIIVGVIIGVGASYILEQCAELGPGVHDVDGVALTCP